MSEKTEALVGYVERLAACMALAAGGALIIHYAPKLMFGPWVPRIVGAGLYLLAFFLIGTAKMQILLLYLLAMGVTAIVLLSSLALLRRCFN